jgi:hypothetical protein
MRARAEIAARDLAKGGMPDSSLGDISVPLMASQVEYCTRITASMLASANFE